MKVTSCPCLFLFKGCRLNFDIIIVISLFILAYLYVALMCTQFVLFHQSNIMAFPKAPVPPPLNVCFDYVLSRSRQGKLSV